MLLALVYGSRRLVVLQGDPWKKCQYNFTDIRYCTVAYTVLTITFYKVPKQHSHVYLVGLYSESFRATKADIIIY